jgi:hypothetical protein
MKPSKPNTKHIPMNKIMIGVIVSVFVLGGLVWFARPSAQEGGGARIARSNSPSNSCVSAGGNDRQSAGERALTVEESDSCDFGTISMAKGVVKHEFKIKNTSNKGVVVNKMYTSCMCTTATFMIANQRFGPYGMPGHGFIPRIGKTIDPGQEAVVQVVFDPAAHGPAGVGKIERTIIIETNDGRPLELGFAAKVTP